jgi:hypothetical protein
MFKCSNCSSQFTTPTSVCNKCGMSMSSEPQQESVASHAAHIPRDWNARQAITRGFLRVFGLHPGVAIGTILVNLVLFGMNLMALIIAAHTDSRDIAVALVISVEIGALAGYLSYLGQIKWYGDDRETAMVKGTVTGVITAIPTGLLGMLFGGIAIAGWLLREERCLTVITAAIRRAQSQSPVLRQDG